MIERKLQPFSANKIEGSLPEDLNQVALEDSLARTKGNSGQEAVLSQISLTQKGANTFGKIVASKTRQT